MLQAHLTKRSHVQCVAALAGMAAGGSPRLTACTRAQESALPLWAPGCIARRSALVTHCTRQRMCWRRGCTLSLQGASRTRRMARRMRACARARQPCRAASAQRLARKSALRARASAGTQGPPRRRAGRAGQGRARAGAQVHISVATRKMPQGVRTLPEILALAQGVEACPSLHLRGIMTHGGDFEARAPAHHRARALAAPARLRGQRCEGRTIYRASQVCAQVQRCALFQRGLRCRSPGSVTEAAEVAVCAVRAGSSHPASQHLAASSGACKRPGSAGEPAPLTDAVLRAALQVCAAAAARRGRALGGQPHGQQLAPAQGQRAAHGPGAARRRAVRAAAHRGGHAAGRALAHAHRAHQEGAPRAPAAGERGAPLAVDRVSDRVSGASA